ncbi:MAG: hypothetical protein M0004_05755 [Actinomycetota bacterium]|nr:hypothetical protein [Actinomycetota bacterium]
MTELATGLGMLGDDSLEAVFARRPPEMTSVAPELWDRLDQAYAGGALEDQFQLAWANGRAFLEARDGLRGRHPLSVEWKGSHRAPGDEVAPIDLRIDHVYLVSCKYASKIMINTSPFHLFEHLLRGAQGTRSGDWYAEMAPREYEELYSATLRATGVSAADSPAQLDARDRAALATALAGGWPEAVQDARRAFVRVVAEQTASRWRHHVGRASAEPLLWRLLRMGSAPYFLLGGTLDSPLRLRVATPWDWRQSFRLRRFVIEASSSAQPSVTWQAAIEDRHRGELCQVAGHVEVRWSHGRFGGNPEAKVYLDTPHRLVPGYFALS